MNEIETTAENFTKVIQFKILRTIQKNWTTLENFKRDWEYQSTHSDKNANRIFKLIWKSFNVDKKTIRSLTQTKTGGRQAKAVKASIDTKRLVFVGKKTATYKSGMKFETDSWFYIPFEELTRLWNIAECEGVNVFDPSSDFYTKEQHKLIDKYILKFDQKPRTYTKTEAFWKYQESRQQDQMPSDAALDELIQGI